MALLCTLMAWMDLSEQTVFHGVMAAPPRSSRWHGVAGYRTNGPASPEPLEEHCLC
jgi:hypothetical protein